MYQFTCTYCNHKWLYRFYVDTYLKTVYCTKCMSKARYIRYDKVSDTKIDTYEGAPDFSEEYEDLSYSLMPNFDEHGSD